MAHITKLESKGKLAFRTPFFHSTFKSYVLSAKSMWFWTVIAAALASSASTFLIPQDAFPQVYLRYLLGSAFILFLPGFCVFKAMFPQRKLDNVETVTISVGTSLATVALVAFLLNFTSWGINAATVSFSISLLVAVSAIIGVHREYEAKAKG